MSYKRYIDLLSLPYELRDKLSLIQLVALDVDGVLTDGKIVLGSDGTEYKSFDVKDGHGLKKLHKLGIQIAWITGRNSLVVTQRASELHIEHLIQGSVDKARSLQEILDKLGLSREQTMFIGDDEPDIAAMELAGISVTVRDGAAEVKQLADLIIDRKGGSGAVRELCDLIERERQPES